MRKARQAPQGDNLRPSTRSGRGLIRVLAEKKNGLAVIRIVDDGPGIPERLAGKLFDAFVSGGGQGGGTGLGLTISRELAAGHGGDLRLIETGPQGTTFELSLPD